jgi:hypothetical protein
MANGDCNRDRRSGPFSRPQYFSGSYLTAADLDAEQNYRLQRIRRHNRELHGWGVVCGMLVVPGRDPAHPLGVQVCPGYAIGPYGDEIEVRERAGVDVRDFLWSRPGTSLSSRVPVRFAYIVIRYRDQPDDLQPLPEAACECDEPAYAPSRILDGYELAVIWAPPVPAPQINICNGLLPCPACPESPWLHLARVLLPAGNGVAITAAMIDNGIRRIL